MNDTYKDIRPYNDKHQRHGLWEIYFDGKLNFKRFCHNGKSVGYEENYSYLDKLNRKRYYI